MKSSRSKKSPGRSNSTSRVSERGFRVADQIQRDIADILRGEVKDPRIGLMTLTEVEITPDYAVARVYYTVFPDSPEDLERTAAGLEACKGFVRGQLGRRLQIHQTPDLRFIHDKSVARGAELSFLIDQANQLPSVVRTGDDGPEEPDAAARLDGESSTR